MRIFSNLLVGIGVVAICGWLCATVAAQEMLDIGAPGAEPASNSVSVAPPAGPDSSAATSASIMPGLTAADSANLDGCQVVARIDDQIILACDVLWRVNQLIETQMQKIGDQAEKISDDQIAVVRRQLMRKEVSSLVDRKLLYNEFRRNVPAENFPRIEENLKQPFEEHELPSLYKQLHVDNKRDLEHELTRLGSSLADVQRGFNERVIAGEWIRSKVKVNEDVSPDQMIEYYKAHLTDYDYPSQARWEELAVRKSRFKDPAEAFAATANLGNEVWQLGQSQPVRGAAFADIAKTKSDGFTAKDGGVHDWTTKGALQCKAIDEAIFALQVGQMSQIIDSGPMFHIVRVLERKDAGRKPYTEVQADIRDKLKDQRFQVEVEKYLSKLRSEARIWTVFTGDVSADVLLGRAPEDTKKR